MNTFSATTVCWAKPEALLSKYPGIKRASGGGGHRRRLIIPFNPPQRNIDVQTS